MSNELIKCDGCGEGPCYHVSGLCRKCRGHVCKDCTKTFYPSGPTRTIRCLKCEKIYLNSVRKVAIHEHSAAS